jgi:hypothetical protein
MKDATQDRHSPFLTIPAAWPSQIDEFVEWAKGQVSGEAMDES